MVKFRRVLESDLLTILHWRTTPRVTRYMSTDIEFDLEKQKKWYEKSVRFCDPAEHWVIVHNNKPVGLLNLEKYDSKLRRTSWGYYIGELDSQIIGALVPAYFYNYIFFHRDVLIDKINGHLFSENTKVLEMHRFYGVKEVGLLKDHVLKYGKAFDIILIEMTRERWLSQNKKFHHYQADFEE